MDQDGKLSVSEELHNWARELWKSGDDLELAQAIFAGHAVWDNALSDRVVWEVGGKDHAVAGLALTSLEVVSRRLDEEGSAPHATRWRLSALRFLWVKLVIPASRLVGRELEERDRNVLWPFLRCVGETSTAAAVRAALRLVDRFHGDHRSVIRGESLCVEHRAELRRVARIPGDLGSAVRALLAAAELAPIAPMVDAAWRARDEAHATWSRALHEALVEDFPGAVPRLRGPVPVNTEHDLDLPAADRRILERVASSMDADASAAARAVARFVLNWGRKGAVSPAHESTKFKT
jgi:hypothetical protein